MLQLDSCIALIDDVSLLLLMTYPFLHFSIFTELVCSGFLLLFPLLLFCVAMWWESPLVIYLWISWNLLQATLDFGHEDCDGYRLCFPFCEEVQVLSLNEKFLECHIKLDRICPSLYAVILSNAYWSLQFQNRSLCDWTFCDSIMLKGPSELPNVDSMCANVWDDAFIIYIHFHTALLSALLCCFHCAWVV